MTFKTTIRLRLQHFKGSHPLEHLLVDIEQAGTEVSFAGARWRVALDSSELPDSRSAWDCAASFEVIEGAANEVSVGVEFTFDNWSKDNYVMMPAAAYNGNRFKSVPATYPPMFKDPADIGPGAGIVITDVPRLNIADGEPSRIQILTSDETTPAVTFFAPKQQAGFICLTEQGSEFGCHGITVEETSDRTQALIRIEAPGVRRDTLYTFSTTKTPSWDRGADWTAGQRLTIRFRVYKFPAKCVQDLFDRFALVRRELAGNSELIHDLPFSAAWQDQQKKFNLENWREEGYYSVGPAKDIPHNFFSDWQLGWVGGGMAAYALLAAGDDLSKGRAISNIDWMFNKVQLPSGLIYAVYDKGREYDDSFRLDDSPGWYMVRKQADGLYFLCKAFKTLANRDPEGSIPEHWQAGTRKLADLFIRTFEKYGQVGQLIDRETGDVIVGGSTAGAILPAALALAQEVFDEQRYLDAAGDIAEHLYEADVRLGVTTGGPGEILKCPDSESAFAMLESFVLLYEATLNGEWLQRAEEMAKQCLTWVASYDFAFPPDSCFGKLGIRAAGSVWANVQNKHSAPGICTLSGDSLFKLYRYTGNETYLREIQVMAHNLTQYLCRTDKQIGDPEKMHPGYICERVNFSDWEGRENIGGQLFGSCWSEVALMLTTIELPGVYAQPDTGLVCAFDHVEATIAGSSLEITNSTEFDAAVRLLIESSSNMHEILEQGTVRECPVAIIPAGDTVRIPLKEESVS